MKLRQWIVVALVLLIPSGLGSTTLSKALEEKCEHMQEQVIGKKIVETWKCGTVGFLFVAYDYEGNPYVVAFKIDGETYFRKCYGERCIFITGKEKI